MWIRSQNKKLLINTEDICIVRDYIQLCDKDVIIGRYDSEKRAIEVLDEIQRELFQGMSMDYITSGGVRHYRTKVFEMPGE